MGKKRDTKGRLFEKRVPSDDVATQGEGSWVAFRRRLKAKHLRLVAEMAVFRDIDVQENPAEMLDALSKMGRILSQFVLDWNWTDEFGDSLPEPRDNPEVFDELGFNELMWLIEQMAQHVGDLQAKN